METAYPHILPPVVAKNVGARLSRLPIAVSFILFALLFAEVDAVLAATTKPVTASPVISLASGTYSTAQVVTLTDLTPGAVVYFAINGSVTTASTKYSGPIKIASNSTIQAMALATGHTVSPKVNAAYTFPAAPPAFSPAPGTFKSAQSITLTSHTPGANIYFTTDGNTPTTASKFYSGPIPVATNQTIRAITVAKNYNTSSAASAAYTVELPAQQPILSPAGGVYTKAKTVSLMCSTPKAVIYYTTDGSTPSTDSLKYSAALTVSANETIKAMAMAPGGSSSSIASATYTIELPAAAPTFSLASGKYTSVQSLVLSDATSAASVYYTTDGSTPTIASTLYTGPITVTATETVRAVAQAHGGSPSPISKAFYTITLPTAVPVISPLAGTYNTVQTVTITDATSGAVIHYTVNGGYPTTASPIYSGPFKATADTHVQAIAIAPSDSGSSVVAAQYTIVAPAPTIVPGSGSFEYQATVTMSSGLSGAAIYYTANGATPTSSSTLYTGPIVLTPKQTSTETFRAIAVASGYLASSPTLSTFTITLPAGVLAQATINAVPQKTIPPDFMGLSIDYTQPATVLGQASTGVNQTYRTLVKNLTQYYSAPLLIRVEGDNTTAANLQPDIEPLVEFANAVDVRYMLGVDLMQDNVDAATAEAVQWANGIPHNLIKAFEIGNEPDNYPYQAVRPSNYAFADYLLEHQQWQSAIQVATGGSIGTMGPSTAGSAWNAASEVSLGNADFPTALVSQHAYCSGPPAGKALPPDYLLEPGNVTKLPSGYAPYAAAAHQNGATFRIGEMNSIGGGGVAGISNSFQSALWAIDVMFNYLNNGMDGVNWHTGQYTNYALFEFKPQPLNGKTVFNLTAVNPEYYGLLVFAQVAGQGAKLLPVTTITDSNVSIWATVDNTSTAHVVVINKDEKATGDVQIHLPGYTTGTVRYLSAPGYASTNGVTLGGQTFDGSTDGTIQGQQVTTTITGQDGAFTLSNMPITTAAIIDFNQ